MCKEVVEVNLHKMNGIKSEREGHFSSAANWLDVIIIVVLAQLFLSMRNLQNDPHVKKLSFTITIPAVEGLTKMSKQRHKKTHVIYYRG